MTGRETGRGRGGENASCNVNYRFVYNYVTQHFKRRYRDLKHLILLSVNFVQLVIPEAVMSTSLISRKAYWSFYSL